MRSCLALSLCLLLSGAPAWADEAGEISATMLQKIQQQYGQVTAVTQGSPVYEVFQTLVRNAPHQNVNYRLEVVDKDVINAYALPDGQIVVFTGLLRALPDRDSLAFVLGHEISHVEDGHSTSGTLTDTALGTAASVLTGGRSWWISGLANLARNAFSSGHSRAMEAEADNDGLELMSKAGFNPQGALTTFRVFEELEAARPGIEIFPSHPPAEDRYQDALAWMEEHDIPQLPTEVAGKTQLPLRLSRLEQEIYELNYEVKKLPEQPGDATARQALTQAYDSLRQYREAGGVGHLEDGLSSLHSFGLLSPSLALPPALQTSAKGLVARGEELEQAGQAEQAERLAKLSAYLYERVQKRKAKTPADPAAVASLARFKDAAAAYQAKMTPTTRSALLAAAADWEKCRGRLGLEPRYYAGYFSAMQDEVVAMGVSNGELDATAASATPPKADPAFAPDPVLGSPGAR